MEVLALFVFMLFLPVIILICVIESEKKEKKKEEISIELPSKYMQLIRLVADEMGISSISYNLNELTMSYQGAVVTATEKTTRWSSSIELIEFVICKDGIYFESIFNNLLMNNFRLLPEREWKEMIRHHLMFCFGLESVVQEKLDTKENSW